MLKHDEIQSPRGSGEPTQEGTVQLLLSGFPIKLVSRFRTSQIQDGVKSCSTFCRETSLDSLSWYDSWFLLVV